MSVLEVTGASRWFGDVVAVNDVTMTLGPGVTGLLGPNGAGKSTLIHLMAGFLAPSAGTVTLDGEAVWRREEVYRSIGLVPEREAMYDVVSAWDFVLANARLQKLPDPAAAARRALETVAMAEVADRDVSTFSKGMKQRIKMATALVHEPSVLLLDEPFNGMDPRQRMILMDLLTRLGDAGRTVVFSSHILEEVEQVASRVEVVVAGRHAASGDFHQIRALMTERPHRYTVRSDDDRALAAAVVARGGVSGIELVGATDGGGPGPRTVTTAGPAAPASLHVAVSDRATFVRALPRLAAEHGIRLYEVSPTDESLESVFSYLVDR